MLSMHRLSSIALLALFFLGPVAFGAEGNFTERYDTPYNNLTIEKIGTVVELRARSRAGVYLESAVDLADPLRLVVPYTQTLFSAAFFEPKPKAVLMIGLGGAGFHRVFAHGYPDALLQSVELDPKVFELSRTHMAFQPTEKTPVAMMDGRLFVKRSKQTWDWIILDAFRSGFVPPHLKTQEFYRECAARLSERGVFVSNLHATTKLYESDLKTIQSVFPQVALFQTTARINVIAVAVKYRAPPIALGNVLSRAPLDNPALAARVDFKMLAGERIELPPIAGKSVRILIDDFSPVEFLDAMKVNNTKDH